MCVCVCVQACIFYMVSSCMCVCVIYLLSIRRGCDTCGVICMDHPGMPIMFFDTFARHRGRLTHTRTPLPLLLFPKKMPQASRLVLFAVVCCSPTCKSINGNHASAAAAAAAGSEAAPKTDDDGGAN